MTFKTLILTTAAAGLPVLLAAQGQSQTPRQPQGGGRAQTPAPQAPGPRAAAAPAQEPSTPAGQGGLDPASMLKPLAESWPTYSGDYTGRRYSTLTQLNQGNVKNLTLAWVSKLTAGAAAPAFGGGRGGAAPPR